MVTTARAINDTTAREFAVDFYTHIGNGKGIDHAFAQYPHRHSMKNTELRGLYWKGMDETFMDGFPWKLHPAQSEGEAWSLSLAADDPLYGLPAIPPRFDLPEDPFRYLHWFERKHAEVFFGRGHQIRQLYEQLGNSPLTLLYGKSGVGKSSLLHAGLFPRLEESHDIEYLRRDPIKGLAVMVTELLGTATELRTVWQKREQKSGKPFLLILDQVEEAFTRPLHGNAHEKELKTLAAQLYQIFGDPLDRPGGHVILAFRKEYYPEINKILREAEVSRSGLFLEPLRRANVMAAVAGLTKNKRLKQAYKLEVEEDLPARIADDLLEDAESAVAPVLQILLTRLWEKAMGDAPHAPAFSHAAYLGLKKEGLLLGDFLDRQLKRLHVLCPEWIESGLVLDMLFRFTTTAGTSARKTWETWKQSYSLDESALTKLKDHLTNCYLLIKVGEDSYQLAHDTLAPLIRVQYELSDRPGQRADRILRGKIRLGKDASQLSNLELTIIEDGLAGRKIYSKEEKALIKKAKTYWQKSDKKEAAEQKVLQSLQTIDTNPSQSFQYAEEAWQLASLPQALRAMHQAYYHTVYKRGDTLFATPL